ncbi:MAG: VWA domain-containing protein [Myxococcales bacterium]|nr:VWA domain-containing protein [Myxococcales bacterium]
MALRTGFLVSSLAVGTALVVGASCGARSGLPIYDGAEGGFGTGGSGGGPPDCTVLQSSTQLAPLDMFIMLDASGSMEQPTGDGQTKWDAVRAALEAFSADNQSAGITVSLAFFPILDPAVPDNCFSDADCGADPGLCDFYNICSSGGAFCNTELDCDNAGLPDDTCIPLGQCDQSALLCTFGGEIPCPMGAGTCIPIGACRNRTVCESAPYEKLAVTLEELPFGTTPIKNALSAKILGGATPTLPALTGALARAGQQAAAEPEHKVIVVLATDGFPTACDPDLETDPAAGIANIAAVAAEGTLLDIKTFVIGVFSPEEATAADQNLGVIAAAGGTDEAFVVTTDQQVATALRNALNEVRVNAEACSFAIQDDIDLDTVWLRITPSGGGEPVWVPRVSGPEACEDDAPAFYVEASPEGGYRIVLCPEACGLLGSSPDRRVEIHTTCPDPTKP